MGQSKNVHRLEEAVSTDDKFLNSLQSTSELIKNRKERLTQCDEQTNPQDNAIDTDEKLLASIDSLSDMLSTRKRTLPAVLRRMKWLEDKLKSAKQRDKQRSKEIESFDQELRWMLNVRKMKSPRSKKDKVNKLEELFIDLIRQFEFKLPRQKDERTFLDDSAAVGIAESNDTRSESGKLLLLDYLSKAHFKLILTLGEEEPLEEEQLKVSGPRLKGELKQRPRIFPAEFDTKGGSTYVPLQKQTAVLPGFVLGGRL